MKKKLRSLIELTENDNGYSILNCVALTTRMAEEVRLHISRQLSIPFGGLLAAAQYVEQERFSFFREKKNRMLDRESVEKLLIDEAFITTFSSRIDDFITDEEGVDFPNIYWRIVRPNSPSDVGPIHADQWFWELGHGVIPERFRRVKIWMPLLQSDSSPGLVIVPGSQKLSFNYGSQLGLDGKVRPTFDRSLVQQKISNAPVKVGQAIVFHDGLLHGGQVSDVLRVSVEWTFACLE